MYFKNIFNTFGPPNPNHSESFLRRQSAPSASNQRYMSKPEKQGADSTPKQSKPAEK